MMLHNTTGEMPQDRSRREECKIEKTPLCHLLQLRAEKNEGRWWRMKQDKDEKQHLTESSVIRSEYKLIYTTDEALC